MFCMYSRIQVLFSELLDLYRNGKLDWSFYKTPFSGAEHPLSVDAKAPWELNQEHDIPYPKLMELEPFPSLVYFEKIQRSFSGKYMKTKKPLIRRGF